MERVLPHTDPIPSTPPNVGPPSRSGSDAAEPVAAPSRRRRRTEVRRSRPSAGRGLSRGAVLAALAAATIAFPVVDVMSGAADPAAGSPVAGDPLTGGPTAREVLSATTVAAPPTTLLASGRVRELGSVSRAVDREPLPGCDGEAKLASSNGEVPTSDLCTLWDGQHLLRGDAAVALTELNLAYRAAFGRDLCITDSYRPLAVQRRLAAQKPRLAATPGRSNHGWGLAIDLCSTETNSSGAMSWLRDNGPTFGWDNPAWARRGGSGPYEPWHWEYVPGTTSLGTNWG